MSSKYELAETQTSFSLVFSSDLNLVKKAVADASAFVIKRTTGFDLFTFKLALFESLTNAAKHGCRLDPKLNVKLIIELKNSALTITINDEGDGFDWRSQMDKSEEICDPESPSGRGLFLLKSYNCHPCYNDKGNVLSLRIDLV